VVFFFVSVCYSPLYDRIFANICIHKKSLFADFFSQEDSQAAFANIIIQSGSAAAFGAFIYPLLSGDAKCIIVTSCSALGYICFLIAFRIHNQEKLELHEAHLDDFMMQEEEGEEHSSSRNAVALSDS